MGDSNPRLPDAKYAAHPTVLKGGWTKGGGLWYKLHQHAQRHTCEATYMLRSYYLPVAKPLLACCEATTCLLGSHYLRARKLLLACCEGTTCVLRTHHLRVAKPPLACCKATTCVLRTYHWPRVCCEATPRLLRSYDLPVRKLPPACREGPTCPLRTNYLRVTNLLLACDEPTICVFHSWGVVNHCLGHQGGANSLGGPRPPLPPWQAKI